jgi:hypothetical protein
MLLVFVQQRATAPASLVLQRRRVVVLGVNLDPFVDTLPGHREHAGDIGGAATVVELQDGQGPAKQAGIRGLRELTPEAPPLPGSQVEPAHGLLLHPEAADERTACQINSGELLRITNSITSRSHDPLGTAR